MTNDAKDRPASTPWIREPKSDISASSIERMPRFHDWLERFGECVGELLSQTFGPGFSGAIEASESTSAVALLDAHRTHTAAVFRSTTLDAPLLMILDPRIVDIVVGAMFGVEAAPDDDEAPVRTRTELETRLVIEFVKGLATALCNAGAALADSELTFERLTTLEEHDLFDAQDMATIAASFTIKTPGGSVGLILALPQTLIAPLSEYFERDGVTAGSRQDANWARQLEQGVTQARLTLTAILDEFAMTLRDVSELSVGRMLPLSGDGEGKIRLDCAERGVFLCKLRERNDRYALEIEGAFPRNADPASFPTIH
jgi:flagellar motor switch protein FliM